MNNVRITAHRQARSLPVLDAIDAWLTREGELLPPRSLKATAITYAKNQWTAINMYLTQGFLNIDNSASQRTLKRVTLRRKKWLFAGHDAAAQNRARLWSLIASAERHTIAPERYLTSVLAKIPTTTSAEPEEILSGNWKHAEAAESPTDD